MSSIIIRCLSLFTLKLFLVKWLEFTLLKLCRVLFDKLFSTPHLVNKLGYLCYERTKDEYD